MCFDIHNDHKRVKTATKNIACYKRFNVSDYIFDKDKFFTSPFEKFKYEKGYCYFEDSFIESKRDNNHIYIGLHSYTTVRMAKSRRLFDEIVVACIIPAGAKYYFNPDDEEYVSDYLMIGTDDNIIY